MLVKVLLPVQSNKIPLSSGSLICPPSYGLGTQYFVSTPLVFFLSPLLRPLIAGFYLLLLTRA